MIIAAWSSIWPRSGTSWQVYCVIINDGIRNWLHNILVTCTCFSVFVGHEIRRKCINYLWATAWGIHRHVVENCVYITFPESKVHGTNMGPTWVLSVPDGPHVGPMNLADRVVLERGPVSRVSSFISCCVQNAELLYEATGSIVFHLCHIYLLHLSCRSPTMSCPYAVLLYTVMSSPVLSCTVLVPSCPYLVPALPCPCPAPVTYYIRPVLPCTIQRTQFAVGHKLHSPFDVQSASVAADHHATHFWHLGWPLTVCSTLFTTKFTGLYCVHLNCGQSQNGPIHGQMIFCKSSHAKPIFGRKQR